ncbi:MAG: two-component regulator propeller domain-containing protein [Cyclobacteriaceae bacterium]|nr:two-component regulator propeller domain-containing protein [Cyclobacteriaceae bacterium]
MTYRIILQSIFLYALSVLNVNAQDFQISSVSLPSTHSTNSANGITQDQYGNIWMSSGGQGLIRYNGKDFTFINSERDNPNSLVSDRLECIDADHNGYIWVGSFSAGLSRYDNISGTFKNFIHDVNDSLTIRSNAIRCFADDTNGGIWIGTAEGIDYWNPATKQFEHNFAPSEAAETLQKEHVRVLYIDKSGILWAGTSSPFYGEQSEGGLFRIDPSTKKSIKIFSQ